ncbi:F-box and associated interaction domains-containing protein, putative isoform 1 [Hibiscus syriacus]|uniref:F-box and associated interaction domains-containing protein, putative isoform 1 n=1 Tax=Hibiscus syriacus TaxID=106335 RepID=A0A6A2ZTL9_HIBSY|nr:F-box protein At3g07870-like [Hibiscus syriacus]KAE8695268.1 F-box and associated interaction domains-containing protein, putative isoform 1 [Hibiscus syriacus]
MDRLPQELVLDILSRLPTPSLVQSKSVSRGWRILIRDQALVNKHFNRVVENDPTFILQIRDQPAQNQLYFGDFSNHGDVMIITKKLTMPPLPTFHLLSSCNGLLCLRGTHGSFGLICIYNPFTRDYIELPKQIAKHPSHHVGVLGFGLDSTTKKYKVVEVLYKGITRRAPLIAASSSSIESVVHILSVGSPSWRNLGSFPFHFMWQNSQVLVNGKLHWISYPDKNIATNRIMSFDLANEQFQKVPGPDCISSDRQFHEIVVLRGCLSAVSFNDDDRELEIWVMKEYDVRESWVKEFSIGAYVPRILQPNDVRESLNSSMYYSPKKCMRVLCLLRSGGILLEYKSKAVVVYDPHCMTFQDLQLAFEGIPRCFRVVLHAACLSWIDAFVNT